MIQSYSIRGPTLFLVPAGPETSHLTCEDYHTGPSYGITCHQTFTLPQSTRVSFNRMGYDDSILTGTPEP